MSVFPNKDRLGNVTIMVLRVAASKWQPPGQVSTVGATRLLRLFMDRECCLSVYFFCQNLSRYSVWVEDLITVTEVTLKKNQYPQNPAAFYLLPLTLDISLLENIFFLQFKERTLKMNRFGEDQSNDTGRGEPSAQHKRRWSILNRDIHKSPTGPLPPLH